MEKRMMFSRIFDVLIGAIIGALVVLCFLFSNRFITINGNPEYNSMYRMAWEWGRTMPTTTKDALVQSNALELAEVIINSGDHVYAPSRVPEDYRFESVSDDTWVVFCNDEVIGLLSVREDISGTRILNYGYKSTPFSMHPEYEWEGPISDKPGWLYDTDVFS